jgi:hypothetical protein
MTPRTSIFVVLCLSSLALLAGCAIDQHFAQHKRCKDI